ncbi:MAG: tyrosine-type recombinase/integrase [Proteobacteria bacterium]|nr:tyrosine-type recombinase/integrase [Pseudomonadota bacterium]
MAKNKLSYDSDVKNAPENIAKGEKEIFLRDGDGLELRITQSGRYWQYRFTWEGQRGVFPMNGDKSERDEKETTAKNELAEARRWAAWCRAQKNANLDPRKVRADAEAARKKAILDAEAELIRIARAEAAQLSMNDLYEQWDKTHGATLDTHWRAVRRSHWQCHLAPIIGSTPIAEANKVPLMEIHDRLTSQGKKATARSVLALLIQLVGWGVERGIVADDHRLLAFKLPKKQEMVTEGQKGENFRADDYIVKHGVEIIGQDGEDDKAGRALQFSELSDLLSQSLAKSSQALTGKCIIRYMLATGVRASQAVRLRWDWVSLDHRVVIYPTGSMKKRKMHHVHLSDYAFKQINLMLALRVNDFVFPAPIKEAAHVRRDNVSTDIATRQHYSGDDLVKRMKLRRAVDQYNFYNLTGGKWALYDLRRTAATRLMELTGSNWDIVQKILAHSQKEARGETDKYDRFSRWADRCNALNQWGEALATCEAGNVPLAHTENVIKLKTA